ncbi:unnamed protein product, partial [Vitis vinifera]
MVIILFLESFKSLPELKKLEILNLRYNWFNKTIIKQLSGLTSLKTLVVSNNHIEGFFPSQELSIFGNLMTLDLSWNRFNGSLSIQDFASLSNLEVLDLSDNSFSGILPSSIRLLSSLKSLYLAGNHLNGSLPNQGFCQFNKFQELDLSYNLFQGILPPCLNNFTSLRLLDLSSNLFSGNLSSPLLPNLTSLEYIDLSYNQFEGSFSFSSFANYSKLQVVILGRDNNKFEVQTEYPVGWVPLFLLKALVLSNCKLIGDPGFLRHQLRLTVLRGNLLSGFIPYRLCHLTKISFMDLSNNNFSGSIPGCFDFASLSNLEMLDLSYNSLSGIIPLSIRLMPHLKSLSLAGNHLNGSLQNQGFCQLNKLQELDLSYNLFQGILPPCLNNFTSLRLLDLSANLFSGNLSSPLLPNLTSLEYIDLSYNQFEGSFSFSSFANHSKLQVVILGSDNNKFEVETEYPVGWVPLFQLKVLSLSSCKLTGDLPGFLQYQFRLVRVDLSHNNLTGSFPNWLLANNTRLEFLVLRNNSLMGQLLPLRPTTRISSLDISHNQLDGQLQENVAHMIPHIMSLNLSNNGFEGILPSSIAEMISLRVLDLSANNFSGEVPKQLLATKRLEILKLSNNKFHGEIFSRDFNLTWVEVLCLGNNQFTGTLSNVISKNSWLSGLEFLDVSQNALSGSLPSLKNLLNLKHLHLQGNMFTRLIPRDFLNSSNLLTLDIRENSPIYKETDEVEFVTKNRRDSYKGGILEFMSGLDLSCNNLTGEIPHELGMLSSIHALNLSHNQLNGSIPKSFSNLSQIESLDLSYNKLGGEIPLELVELNFLEVFSVAYNNISGRVPNTKAQFGTFDESNYEGNPFLCGELLKRKCNTSIESPCAPSQSFKSEAKWYDINHVVFFASFTTSYIMILLGFVTMLYINPYWRHRWFNFIEECIYSYYYFASDSLSKLSTYLYN